MKRKCQKAWNKFSKLPGDEISQNTRFNVTSNQVASKIVLERRNHEPKKQEQKINRATYQLSSDRTRTIREVSQASNETKNGKAAGIDDICKEKIAHLTEKGVQ